MKRIFLVGAIVTLSAAAEARDSSYAPNAHRTARELSTTLNQYVSESYRISSQAQRNGNRLRANNFANLANQAQNLKYQFDSRVLRPLTRGRGIQQASRQLDSLSYDFQSLDSFYRRLQTPPLMDSFHNRIQSLRYHLSRELRDVRPDPFPNPGRRGWECNATDRGWEEHFGGHPGYGRTRYQAENQALRECQRHHGNCMIRSCQQVR